MKTQILKDFTQQGTGRRAGNADCGGDAGKSQVGGWGREKERGRDNFFILILKYLLPEKFSIIRKRILSPARLEPLTMRVGIYRSTN